MVAAFWLRYRNDWPQGLPHERPLIRVCRRNGMPKGGRRKRHEAGDGHVAPGTCTGVIPPIAATATDLALTECDAQDAIDMVHGSRWDALTRDFWWRGVTMSRTRYNGSQRQMCLCCEAAPSSFLHTVTECAVFSFHFQSLTAILSRRRANA